MKLQVLPNHTVHWLDLMYHLIVPRSQPQPQPQPEPEPQAPDPGVEEFFLTYFGFGQWEILALPVIMFFIHSGIYICFSPWKLFIPGSTFIRIC